MQGHGAKINQKFMYLEGFARIKKIFKLFKQVFILLIFNSIGFKLFHYQKHSMVAKYDQN
jgi:hypothetical protein